MALAGTRVRSHDGTVLDVKIAGKGPPMVLVHGAATDRRCWSAVVDRLSERFTVHFLDRRGRRGSATEGGPYDLAREGEDVAAVVEAAGREVYLVGHSYGTLCALEAALLSDAVGRMLLFDPPVPTPGRPVADTSALRRLRAAADLDEVLSIFFGDVARLSAAEIAATRTGPVWRASLESAPTVLREVESAAAYRVSDRLAQIAVPVRILVGTESTDLHRAAAEAIAARLPRGGVAELAGRGHLAIVDAPDDFAAAVLAFA
jgi:pimeloyl-ACP methyl ester carboxylesterase